MQPVERRMMAGGFRHRPRQVVDAAAADTQNLGLFGDRQIVARSIIALRSAVPPW